MSMMTRTGRVLTVATATLAIVMSTHATSASAQAPAAADIATGQTLYVTVGCATCHGPNGQGTAAAPRLAGSADALPAFLAYVRDPALGMPAQGVQVVSDEGLTAIYAFLHSPLASEPGQATDAAPAGNAETGAMLFRRDGCYQCHANEAQGGANGPRIGPDPIPFARFSRYVRNPTGSMPPYSDKVLSDQGMADIHAFLRARTRPPAIDTIPLLAP
ncbi:MAG: cytochrome c [Acidobacteria bacterium]|nr:cytochrome c [Acidobacteriota bacterium]